MVLAHFLLTRFSCDAGGSRVDTSMITSNHTTVRPLARHRIEKRLKLFEMFCVPSVLGQTTREFTWMVIVDPRLPSRHRERLLDLTRPHRRTFIVDYDPARALGRLGWLRPYVENAATTHVATTNIDDDDLIGVDLVRYTQHHLRLLANRRRLPSCQVIACVKPLQWDLMPTRDARLGYLKPWHRANVPTFAGYTVCCRQPEYDLSVLAFEHTSTVRYFDPAVVLADRTQAQLRAAADRAGDDWRAWTPNQHVHVIRPPDAQVVVVNHLENDQISRLFERWSTRRPLRDPSDLPDMVAAYDKVPLFIGAFRRTPAAFLRHLYRGVRTAFSSRNVSPRVRWQRLVSVGKFPVWFIRGLPEGLTTQPPRSRRPSAVCR